MKLKSKMKAVVVAVVLGAVIAYLMDPAAGRRRRDRLVGAFSRRTDDLRHVAESSRRVKEAVVADEPDDGPEPVEEPPAVAGVTDSS